MLCFLKTRLFLWLCSEASTDTLLLFSWSDFGILEARHSFVLNKQWLEEASYNSRNPREVRTLENDASFILFFLASCGKSHFKR